MVDCGMWKAFQRFRFQRKNQYSSVSVNIAWQNDWVWKYIACVHHLKSKSLDWCIFVSAVERKNAYIFHVKIFLMKLFRLVQTYTDNDFNIANIRFPRKNQNEREKIIYFAEFPANSNFFLIHSIIFDPIKMKKGATKTHLMNIIRCAIHLKHFSCEALMSERHVVSWIIISFAKVFFHIKNTIANQRHQALEYKKNRQKKKQQFCRAKWWRSEKKTGKNFLHTFDSLTCVLTTHANNTHTEAFILLIQWTVPYKYTQFTKTNIHRRHIEIHHTLRAFI